MYLTIPANAAGTGQLIFKHSILTHYKFKEYSRCVNWTVAIIHAQSVEHTSYGQVMAAVHYHFVMI